MDLRDEGEGSIKKDILRKGFEPEDVLKCLGMVLTEPEPTEGGAIVVEGVSWGRQEILEDSGYFEFEMQQDVQLVMSLSSWIYGSGTKERNWGWRYRTGSHCCRGGVWRRLLMR